MKRGFDKLSTSGGFVADFKRRWDSFIAHHKKAGYDHDPLTIHDYEVFKPNLVENAARPEHKNINELPGQLKTPEVKR